MKRRDLLKAAGAAPFGMAVVSASAQAPDASNYPLNEQVRQEFERLLDAQEGRANIQGFTETPRTPKGPLDRYLMWSLIAHDASALDHVPTNSDIPEVPQRFGFQLGPHRSSRAMAIVHIAMFEALNAVTQKYKSYVGLAPSTVPVSVEGAVAWAAHDALIVLYPYQQQRISALLTADLIRIPDMNNEPDPAKAKAITEATRDLGKAAAAAILSKRANDNSAHMEPQVGQDYTLKKTPGAWDIDPVSNLSVALGAKWGAVTPFVIQSADQFEPVAPPDLTSTEYAEAYSEVKRIGGDPLHNTPTERMDFETFEGVFWAYDGTPGLCAPPRLYNKLAQDYALQKGVNDLTEMARLLAILNAAMADAAISAWHAKWKYEFWRPITAIQFESDNPAIISDPNYYPLGAPATNGRGPNFTPPFPAFPSGHAVFGGAVCEVLRLALPNVKNQAFTFVSDEFNGQNRGIGDAEPRPRLPQSFVSLAHAEYLNARSRLFLGIHFRFDATTGIKQGNEIGRYVFSNMYPAT
ncbi:vanadium-dependent haloperoxidase [Pararhizobium sp. YC-54]|uniref:vanadium-dependent haloperoxidase n=1 Tax=Pararhizobium sp. YC-54 TaxID=2986920 RepID=UPI0021F773A7|nr:vanadium-dependent haloperoxidase [Pararhizobium sp. YC-54]MCV9999534.1 vanadium-dependent haloperoxidase [Pararhizobium sp. YC-54]